MSNHVTLAHAAFVAWHGHGVAQLALYVLRAMGKV